MEPWVIAVIIASVIVVLFIAIIILLSVRGDNISDIPDVKWHDKRRYLGMPISFTRYILTDKKLITRCGLFSLKEDEVNLYRVYDKRIEMGFFERLFNCGTIILLSKDADSSKKVIKSVKNVRTTAKLIDEYIEAERTKYAVRGRDMIGSHIHGDHDCDEIIDDEVIV